jgi:hypothetical protein
MNSKDDGLITEHLSRDGGPRSGIVKDLLVHPTPRSIGNDSVHAHRRKTAAIRGHIITNAAAQQQAVPIIGVSNLDRVDAAGIGALYIR